MIPEYPFPDQNLEVCSRLKRKTIKKSKDNLFPDLLVNNKAYHRGLTSEEWPEIILELLIWCKAFKIKKLYLVWKDRIHKIKLKKYSYRELTVMPKNWGRHMLDTYKIGTNINSVGTFYKTFSSLPYGLDCQITFSNSRSLYPPKPIKSCKSLVKKNNYKVFVHGPYSVNLARINPIFNKIIESSFDICHENKFRGFILHVGKAVEIPIKEALKNMKNNLKEFLKYGNKKCPLLLETPSGVGTEMLVNYKEMFDFMQPFGDKLGFVVDTCHVFAAGYPPDQYLLEALKRKINVVLIHFNGSLFDWNTNKDRHVIYHDKNKNKIPWIYLENVAKIATLHNIPMIIE